MTIRKAYQRYHQPSFADDSVAAAVSVFARTFCVCALQTMFRAVETPMQNVEVIWRDYDQFENDVNRALVNKVLPSYCIFGVVMLPVVRQQKVAHRNTHVHAHIHSLSHVETHDIDLLSCRLNLFLLSMHLGICKRVLHIERRRDTTKVYRRTCWPLHLAWTRLRSIRWALLL